MTTINMQKVDNVWCPRFPEDIIENKNYKENQIVRFKVKTLGAKKQRSLEQLHMYWGLIRTVFHNTTLFMLEKQLSEYIKLKVGYVDSVVWIDGKEHIITGSLSFDKMDHARFCIFFKKAIPVMADIIGVTEDKLKAQYKG